MPKILVSLNEDQSDNKLCVNQTLKNPTLKEIWSADRVFYKQVADTVTHLHDRKNSFYLTFMTLNMAVWNYWFGFDCCDETP